MIGALAWILFGSLATVAVQVLWLAVHEESKERAEAQARAESWASIEAVMADE